MREFTDQELIRREKAEKLREMGLDPYGNRFDRTAFNLDIKEKKCCNYSLIVIIYSYIIITIFKGGQSNGRALFRKVVEGNSGVCSGGASSA